MLTRLFLPIVALTATISTASADMIPFLSGTPLESSPYASYEGWMYYDSSATRLEVTLRNTSPLDNGGFITGFLFNINGSATASLMPLGEFENLSGHSAAPFGQFDAGAALGGSFNGGGNPSYGIAPGQEQTFHFSVSGADAASLGTLSFLSRASSGTGGNGYSELMVVRFRGFLDGGSNMVPAFMPERPVEGPIPVPLPPAAWPGLFTLLTLGGIAVRQRRRQTSAPVLAR
jgi:MYXO-CTERM domain-containing protein